MLEQMRLAAQQNAIGLDASAEQGDQPLKLIVRPRPREITQEAVNDATRYDPGRSYFNEARGDSLQPLTTQLPSERAGAWIRGENPRDISPGRAKVADLVEGGLSLLPSDSGYSVGTDIGQGDYAQAALTLGTEYADKVVPGSGKLAGGLAMALSGSKKLDPLWHEISGTKLRRPLSDVTVGKTSTNTLTPQQMMDLDALKELVGRDIMFTQSDRTAAGSTLHQVGDVQLDNPVRLRGGQDFARENKAAWASAPDVVTKMAKTAAGLNKPVLAPFTMAHGGQDFSNMAAGILSEQGDILRALPVEDLRDFDKIMREGHGLENKGGKQVQTYKAEPDWPGLEDLDKSRRYLQSEGRGQARKAFVDLLDKKTWQDRGFPSAGEARYAATEPALLDRPSGEVGHTLMNVEPRIFTDPKTQHPAYPMNLGGGYLGTLQTPIPTNILAREHIAARRAAGIKEGQGDYRSMQMKPIVQRFDQALLDRVRRYYEEGK